MKVQRLVWLLPIPFSRNTLDSDTPCQSKIILTKTCGVVKPDLGGVIEFSPLSTFGRIYGIRCDQEIVPTIRCRDSEIPTPGELNVPAGIFCCDRLPTV